MLALNGLSPALAWVVHHRPLSGLGLMVIGFFASGNAALGLWLAWRLMRD